MTAPARQLQPASDAGSLVAIAQGMLIQSYANRETTRHLSHGLQLHLQRERRGGGLRLTVRRPGSRPSDLELEIVRAAFGAGYGTRQQAITAGVIITWRDDLCFVCGAVSSPHGCLWGVIQNHVLCAVHYPPAAEALRAAMRAAVSVEQMTLF